MARKSHPQQADRTAAAADDVVAAMVGHDLAALRSAGDAQDGRLQDMLGLWDETGDLRHSSAYADLLGRPTLRERIVALRQAIASSPWRFAMPALPVAALAAYVGLLLLPRPLHYEAGSQPQSITLPDGSAVALAPQSRLDYAARDGRRQATLVGEATFSVAHDAAHPFHVAVGDADIQVVGTRFTLSHRTACTQLSVLSGTVLMRSPSMPVRRVKAGEEGVAVDNGAPYTLCLSSDATASKLRWTYVDVPLATLLADVGRFYPGKIVLQSARAAQERVTISITADQIDTLVDILPEIAGVTASREADHIVLGEFRGEE